MKEAIRALLEADGSLAALLIGGVYASVEISRQETAAVFDANNEIQPCANVRLEINQPFGPYPDSAEQFFTVSLYQLADYDVIEPAVTRVYELLHRQRVGADTWEIRHVNTVPEVFEPALKCSMAVIRFVAVFSQL